MRLYSANMWERIILILALVGAGGDLLSAATYYVSTSGSDSANGSSASPWRTIQHAESSVSAGDTVNVQPGTYVEYVTLNTSGTAGHPVTFNGSSATLRGFSFAADYNVINGFNLDLHVGSATSANIYFGSPASHNLVTNCFVNVQGASISAIDVESDNNFNVFQGCTLANVFDYSFVHIAGSSNLVTQCLITNGNGADIFYIFGNNNTISSNEVYGCIWGDGAEHPDLMQTFNANSSDTNFWWVYNIVFEANYVHDCNIDLGNLEPGYNSAGVSAIGYNHDWDIRNNVFANVAIALFDGVLNTRIYNNVFYNCGIPATGILEMYHDGDHDSDGSEIVNNIFVPASGVAAITSGGEDLASLRIDHNYFASGTIVGNNTITNGITAFVNGGAYNFHLQAASICVGAGTNLSSRASTVSPFDNDKDNNLRPGPGQGSWDLGPYVFKSAGSVTNPVIAVMPASLFFGGVLANASTTNSLTVRNVGGGTLAGIATVPAPFAIVSGATYSLGSNQSQTVLIRFTPGTNASANSQTVTFTGGGGARASVSGQLLAISPDSKSGWYANLTISPEVANARQFAVAAVP
jgi:hypothetical protein